MRKVELKVGIEGHAAIVGSHEDRNWRIGRPWGRVSSGSRVSCYSLTGM